MSSGPAWGMLLVSFLSATPIIVTLLISLAICWRQRHHRPRTAQLMGWATCGYLFWVSVGTHVYSVVLVLNNSIFAGNERGEMVWALKLMAIGLVPATWLALIWGCALWAIFMVDEYQHAPHSHS